MAGGVCGHSGKFGRLLVGKGGGGGRIVGRV